MNINRTLSEYITSDLKRHKMILIGGPRQVGKTTLAKSYTSNGNQYLNWDYLSDREIIRKHNVDHNLSLVVLDEIHKYAKWRMLIKGLYDKYKESLAIIVTGSARLDHFRKGGDSLFGRYHYYRLHPLTLGELDPTFSEKTLNELLLFSGFPEPFFEKNEDLLRRWNRERISRVVNQDIRDMQNIKELSLMEMLIDLLPSKVGSLLSIKSLQEDLEVSPNTVSKWIELLELVYYCYRISPYGSPKIRAIKKAQKLYLWNWTEITEKGALFENLVASHLLKYCHFLEDTKGHRMELRYLRDVDGREVDFVVIKDKKPVFAVECKSGEKELSPSIIYFKERTNIPKFYQVHLGTGQKTINDVKVLPFREFCRIEGIP